MGRALYDARPKPNPPKNHTVRKSLLPLLILSALSQIASPAAGDRTIFANSDLLPGAVDPGFDPLPWPDDADVVGTGAGTPLDRWTAQAEAGRARAAAIVGRYWLERIQESKDNCAKAVEWYTRADKLGSNEAPVWLGHLYRRFDCPQRELEDGHRLAAQGGAADVVWLRRGSVRAALRHQRAGGGCRAGRRLWPRRRGFERIPRRRHRFAHETRDARARTRCKAEKDRRSNLPTNYWPTSSAGATR